MYLYKPPLYIHTPHSTSQFYFRSPPRPVGLNIPDRWCHWSWGPWAKRPKSLGFKPIPYPYSFCNCTQGSQMHGPQIHKSKWTCRSSTCVSKVPTGMGMYPWWSKEKVDFILVVCHSLCLLFSTWVLSHKFELQKKWRCILNLYSSYGNVQAPLPKRSRERGGVEVRWRDERKGQDESRSSELFLEREWPVGSQESKQDYLIEPANGIRWHKSMEPAWNTMSGWVEGW